jgi:hypothetical protein
MNGPWAKNRTQRQVVGVGMHSPRVIIGAGTAATELQKIQQDLLLLTLLMLALNYKLLDK